MRTYKFLMATVAVFMFMIASQANAIQILGTGSGALLGNDLTDVGGDGNEALYSPGGLAGPVYNIQNAVSDRETQIIYNGDFDGYTGNQAYNTINNDGPGGGGGPFNGGDDFSVRAQAQLTFSVGGTFSISAGSDDGRRIELTANSLVGGSVFNGFSAAGDQVDGFSAGDTVVLRNAPTGHAHTTGVFSVSAGDVLNLDTSFYERGGGDQFHVSVKNAADTGHGGTGDGWALLSDGTFGIGVNGTNAGQFDVQMFNVVGGGGSTDNDLNSTAETQEIWNFLDANGFSAGTKALPAPPQNLAGFDAVFFSSNEPGFGGGEFAFNVFDDDVGGGGAKWCCGATGGGNSGQGNNQIVGAKEFISLEGKIELTHFTLTSSNDSPQRDPRGFSIQGSNNTTDGLDGDWVDIFVRVDDGTSDWTARNQVIGYGGMFGDTFLTDEGFTAFRMVTTSTGSGPGGAFFALNEFELFGVQSVPEPTTALLGLMGLAGLATRRRRREA